MTGSMVTVRNDGPGVVEVRYGRGRQLVRAGDECRVYASAVEITPLPKQHEQDALNYGIARPVASEPCRQGHE